MPRGHPGAFDYTPREIEGWVYFMQQQEKRDEARTLDTHLLASRGDEKAIKKRREDLKTI